MSGTALGETPVTQLPRAARDGVVQTWSSLVRRGPIEDAMFAQRTYRPYFSDEGRFANKTIDEVAQMLKDGQLKPSDVPVEYAYKDGYQGEEVYDVQGETWQLVSGYAQREKSCYVAVKGPGTIWTEMENGNLSDGFSGFGDMILIIETPEPKNHWAQPGDDVTPEEVIRLFEADPGLVKNSKQKWWSYSHWPKNFVTADGSYENFDTIKDVEELRKLLIVSPEQIEAVKKKVEEQPDLGVEVTFREPPPE